MTGYPMIQKIKSAALTLFLWEWKTRVAVIAGTILFALGSLHQAMADEFEASTQQDNMQAGGDGGKLFGWHVFNASAADKIDVNVTNSGKLTIDHGPTSTNNFSGSLDGPFVYKIVNGDFDVDVQVSDNSDQPFEGTALMVKQPSGQNHIQIKSVFSGIVSVLTDEFQDTVNGSSTTTTALYEPFLRIQRTGSTFFLYTKPSAGGAWILRRTLSRGDMGTSLQVGIATQTVNTSNTFVSQVEYFRGLPPPTIEVAIDIKPGSIPNCRGMIPVAILGSDSLDVTQIDPATLSFEGLDVRERGNGALSCNIKDTNSDGYADFVCQYQDATTEGTLTGELLDGTPIEGADIFCVVH